MIPAGSDIPASSGWASQLTRSGAPLQVDAAEAEVASKAGRTFTSTATIRDRDVERYWQDSLNGELQGVSVSVQRNWLTRDRIPAEEAVARVVDTANRTRRQRALALLQSC